MHAHETVTLNNHLAKRLRGTRYDIGILDEYPDAARRHGNHRYHVTTERTRDGRAFFLWRDDAPEEYRPGLYLGNTVSTAMDAMDDLPHEHLDAAWNAYTETAEKPDASEQEREWEESVLYRYRTYASWLANQVSPTERAALSEPTAANILSAMRHRGYTGPRTEADVQRVLDAHDLRGGARVNAGAPPKYGERMRTIQVRLPVSAIERAREAGDGNVSAGLRALLGLDPA